MEPLPALLGGGLLFLIMMVLLLAGIHITIVLGISGLAFLFLFYGGWNAIPVIATKTVNTLDSFTLLAIPLFMIMGEFLFRAGIGQDLFNAAEKWIGFLRGGLAMGTVASCAVFAAMCGSSTATAATIGVNAIPEMRRHGYSLRLAAGTVASAGTLGILIPPSIIMIMYGTITQESIGHLFMAGIIPGAVIALLLMLYIYLIGARRGGAIETVSASWRERFVSLRGVWAAVVLIMVVLGGIYLGIMTPTEAAGVGAVASLLVVAINRRLNWAVFKDSLVSAGQTACMILMIVASAFVFGYVLALLQFPQTLALTIASLEVNRWVVMIMINLMLLVLGCVMDAAAMLVITLPIFFPLVMALGFDPIWFGVIYTINMEIAIITPPIGMNLFVIRGLLGEESTLSDVIWGTLPFTLTFILGLGVIMALPELALVLPRLMG